MPLRYFKAERVNYLRPWIYISTLKHAGVVLGWTSANGVYRTNEGSRRHPEAAECLYKDRAIHVASDRQT